MKKNNYSTQLTYLKWQLKSSLKNPLFYITGIIFAVFISINFYIRQRFFTGYGSTDLLLFFSSVPYISILAIPAICYKKSENIYNDFIPLNNLNKIIIRFLSSLIQFVLYLSLLLPASLLINLFGDIDAGQIFTSFLCLIFYGCAVISVTIFINEIVDSSILAFLISAILLGIFNSIHLLTTYVSLNSFFTNIIKNISFIWHFDAAGKGIIDTRDIVWLLCSSILFIYFANIVKQIKCGKKFNTADVFKKVGNILVLVLIIANGSRWYSRIDLSKTKSYSLSDYSKKLIKNIDSQLKITYYRSNSLAKIYPQVRDISDYLTTYSSYGKNVSYLLVDPEKNTTSSEILEKYGITSQPFVNVTKSSTEYTNVYSAIVIEYNGNFEYIPYLLSTESLEFDLAGRITHLLNNVSRTVNIIVGNGMSLTEDYSYVVPLLNAQGFVCNPLFINDEYFSQQLDFCTGPLLIIGDSKIKADQAVAIESYILQNKGNAFFCISPYSCNITKDWNMNFDIYGPLLNIVENWGVHFTENIIGDLSCARITMSSQETDPNNIQQSSLYTKVLNYPLWVNALPQTNSKLGVFLFWIPELELSDYAKPYLLSSPSSWTTPLDRNYPDKMIETNPFILEENGYEIDNKEKIICAKIQGDLTGFYTSFKSKNSQIIVIPDQYFLNSLMNGYIGDTKNFYFTANELLKLNGENELADLQNKLSLDKTLYKITDDNELLHKKNITYFIIFILIPSIMIICEIVIILLQTRKMKNVKKQFEK